MRTIVSLLPRGRLRHGPRRPPLLIVAAGGGQRPLSFPATALLLQLHGLLPYLLVSPPHIQRNLTTVRKKQEMYFFIYGTTFRKMGPDSQIW